MSALWNHHPYLVITVVTSLAGIALIIGRVRGWIEARDILSLIAEVLIIALIVGELVEGARQGAILSALNASTAATAGILNGLQQEQNQALQAQKEALSAMGKQTRLLQRTQKNLGEQIDLAKRQQQVSQRRVALATQQLAVQKQEWARQNQRPLLLVMTLIGSPGRYSWRRLLPNQILGTGHSLGRRRQSLWGKSFFIRDIGNAPVLRPRVTAHVVAPAHFECMVYVPNMVGAQNPCAAKDILPPDLKPDMDLNLRRKTSDMTIFVFFTAPKGLRNVTIYFTTSGDNLSAETYYVEAIP